MLMRAAFYFVAWGSLVCFLGCKPLYGLLGLVVLALIVIAKTIQQPCIRVDGFPYPTDSELELHRTGYTDTEQISD